MDELQKLKQTIQEKLAQKEAVEHELVQLQNQERRILKYDAEKERKARTHRLVERGALLESVLGEDKNLSNESIQELLIAVSKSEVFQSSLAKIKSRESVEP